MTTPHESLLAADTILLVDWPDVSVPETLARAGYQVHSSEGPGPEDYATYSLDDEAVTRTASGRPPAQADVVYSHRPIDELGEIVEMAKDLGATLVWCETGSDEARRIVEGAGLGYADSPSITEAVAGRIDGT